MPDKPDSLNRRDFCGISAIFDFLRKPGNRADSATEDQPATPDARTDRREFIAWARNALVVLGLGKIFWPKKALAKVPGFRSIELKFYKYLKAIDENFAESANRHNTANPGQQPHLWPCDDVSDRDESPSPSFVFEAIKKVEGAIETEAGESSQRRRLIGLLKKLIDNYRIEGGGTLPVYENNLERLESIYRLNHRINSRNLKTWKTLLIKVKGGEVTGQMDRKNLEAWRKLYEKSTSGEETENEITGLKQLVKKAVMADRSAGQELERCAESQENIEEDKVSRLKQTARQPLYRHKEYDKALPEGVSLPGYRCAEIDEDDLRKTSSELYHQLDLLERVIGELVGVAMERERAYVQNEDRAAITEGNTQRALEAVYEGRSKNRASRDRWAILLNAVRELKKEAASAIRVQTESAEFIHRCRTCKIIKEDDEKALLRCHDGVQPPEGTIFGKCEQIIGRTSEFTCSKKFE